MGTAQRTLGMLLTVLALATASCSSDGGTSTSQAGPGGEAVDVTITNFVFDPSTLDLKVGDVVRWSNDQSVTHTATSSDGLWDATLSSGDTFEYTLDEAGTFPYFCAIHPSMTATLEVSG